METAERLFGIPLVVSPENFASENLDELSGMTYLSYFMAENAPGYNATLNWVRKQIDPMSVDNFDVSSPLSPFPFSLCESLHILIPSVSVFLALRLSSYPLFMSRSVSLHGSSCISLYLSLRLSFSLHLSASRNLSASLCHCLCLYHSFTISLPSPSLFRYIYPSLNVPLSLSLSLSIALTLYPSTFALSPAFISILPSLSHSLSLLTLSLSLSPSLSLSGFSLLSTVCHCTMRNFMNYL